MNTYIHTYIDFAHQGRLGQPSVAGGAARDKYKLVHTQYINLLSIKICIFIQSTGQPEIKHKYVHTQYIKSPINTHMYIYDQQGAGVL